MKKILFFILISISCFSQNDTIIVKLQNGAKIYSQPNTNSLEALKNEDNNYIFISTLEDFYKLKSKDIDVYVKKYWIIPNEKIKKIEEVEALNTLEHIRIVNEEIKNEKIKDSLNEIRLLEEIKIKRIKEGNAIKKKYGLSNFNKLNSGKIWIGINKEMTIFALGKPNEINRTVTKNIISEQWVYYRLYVYFENGKVTSFQD